MEKRERAMKINQQAMQTDVDRITEWGRTWKMSLNVDKTKVMVLSSNPEETKWKPVLPANSRRINVTSQTRFWASKLAMIFPESNTLKSR